VLLVAVGLMPRSIANPRPAMGLFYGGFTIFALMYGCVLMIAILRAGHPLTAIPRLGPLMRLGTVSYCVYLLHHVLLHPIYAQARGLGQRWGGTLLAIMLTLLLSLISWELFESRFIHRGHRYTFADQ